MRMLNQINLVPRGGWRYEVTHANGVETIKAACYDRLVSDVRKFLATNSMEIPDNLDLLVSEWICNKLPDQDTRCYHVTPPTKSELMAHAGRSLIKWAKGGFKTVSKETLMERRDTCLKCSEWNGEAALGLGRCGSCGCTGLKMYVATEKCPKEKWAV